LNIAVLRILGNEADINAIKALHSFDIIGEWKKGDPISKSKAFSSSGFNVNLPDGESPVDMVNKIESLLSEYQSNSINFVKSKLIATLDVGFGVGEDEQFAAEYNISLSLMELALKVGVSISLTAYPVDDE